MITNPDNVFEQAQNDIAAALLAVAPFKDIKFPDGSTFDVITEDQGDVEQLFTEYVAKAGLCVIAQSPTAKFVQDDQIGLQANPLVLAVSVSEIPLFNRTDQGTKVRLMVAAKAVLKTLHRFTVPCLKEKLYATAILKDRDTQPETEALVSSRIITFEANQVYVDLAT